MRAFLGRHQGCKTLGHRATCLAFSLAKDMDGRGQAHTGAVERD